MQQQETVIIICSIVGGVVVLILLIVLFIYCYRKHSRYDYTPLIENLHLPVKLKRERKEERDRIREEALLNCHYYLRSHHGKYVYMGYLPNMGSRIEKHWFLVRKIRKSKDLIMNIWQKDPNCPIPFNSTSQKTLREIFVEIKVKPDLYVEDKYGLPGRPLAIREIKVYGLQILLALLYLEEQGFLFHGHIHAGNIIIDKHKCKLTAYENAFLGYSSKLYSVLSKYCKDDMASFDSLSFGHLLFEMGSGEELTQAFPDRQTINRCERREVRELLEYIFDVNGRYPSLKDISQHEFFVGIQLKELENSPPQNIHVTPAMKSIFKAVKKGKKASSRPKQHGRHRKGQSYGAVESRSQAQPTIQHQDSPHAPSVQSVPVAPPPPPPPPLPPTSSESSQLPSVPKVDTDTARGALLSDIRRGFKLRQVENPKV